MAKIIRTRKKRKINLLGYAVILFLFASVLNFSSSIFIRAYTTSTVREIEKNKIIVDQLNRDKEELVREVNAMGDYANIVEKAESAGLHHFIDNSYFVSKGD